MAGRRPARRSWRNWARNQHAAPTAIVRPVDEAGIMATIEAAGDAGRVVRCFGASHSFSDVAATDGVMVCLDHHAGIVSVDATRHRVTVRAGTRLRDLNHALDEVGLALQNLGDIDRQSIAGAIATSTHGTGARRQSTAAAVVGFRLLTADGSVIDCTDEGEPGSVEHETWRLGRVSLGALGVMSTITVQCVPSFRLRAVETTASVGEVLERFDDHAEGNDHFEFFWIPHTDRAITKHNNVTDASPSTGAFRRRLELEAVDNVAFGLLNRVGRRVPGVVPGLINAVSDLRTSDYVAASHEVFCSPRRVRFVETEWAIPRAALQPAFSELQRLVSTLPHPVSFPIEVRVLGADDVALSTAHGRETVYVACHAYVGTPHDTYFSGVEDIMWAHDGRPHWGKLHHKSATELRERYREFDAFVDLRDRLDPKARFANPHLDRVLGRVDPRR